MRNWNAYYLADRYDNVTFGYTNTVPAPPAPGPTVSLTFSDQTGGGPSGVRVPVDSPGYGFSLSWHNDPAMPQGAMSTTVSVTYPTDPEWAGGTVSKLVSFQFDRGTFCYLSNQSLNGYDGFLCWSSGQLGVEDPDFPVTVSPGAEGDSPPKSTDGDPGLPPVREVDGARAHFLIASGTRVLVNVPIGGGDTAVEVADDPAFRVSLVDGENKIIKEGIFRVHRCPRFDHFRPPGEGRPCTLVAVDSVEGIVGSVRVNPNGSGANDSRGYLGVELLRAPVNPGEYYLKFEALEGRPYRIRQQGNRSWDLSPAGEHQGAWHFLTVVGGEFLDESFGRIDPYVVDQDTTAYFRYRAAGSEPVPSVVTIRSESSGQPPETASITIPLNRLAQTSTYMAGPFTLRPPAAEPPASSISRSSVQQPSSLLTVFGPRFQVKAFFLPKQVAQAAGLVNGLPIKVELFYRGEGPPPEQQWFVLRANERAYLGDGLRLTAELPPGWGTPTSYGWSFEVDGLPYTPPGTDPNAQIALVEPIRKAGPWKIKLRVFWGAVERRYERPLDVWFESEPTAAIAWVDPRPIDTTTYVGTTGSTLGDCTKVVSLMIRVLTNLARGQFPEPPPAAERAFYNAATLKCVGPSPSDAIDRPRFATFADLLTYMNHQGGINFKAASALYFRAPVRSGEVKPDRAWRRIPEARAGRSEFILPETLHGLPTGTVFTLPGQTASDNGTFRNRPVGVDNTTYWLNKGRIGLPGQAFACFINTGLPVCDLTNVVPYIWSKLIYTPESPVLRRNLQRTNTSFSTFRFYVPERRSLGLRQFPLVAEDPLMEQSEPNAFLQNPEDSNAD